MIDQRRLQQAGGQVWLVDPTRAQPFALRALRAPCPSAREVARERRKRLAWSRAAATRMVRSSYRGEMGEDPAEMQLAAGSQLRPVRGSVGVIPVYGPIDQRAGAATLKAGGTSCEEVSAALDVLLADKACDAVVLDVDSPGGSAYGVEELADKIYGARGVKPIYAIANSMACSAAYWLASSCGKADSPHLFCTPGGDVGSVGCYLMHVDQSGADEDEGVHVSFVSAGRYKTEANPHEPLTMEARAYLQEQVNATADRFMEGLARNRGCSLQQVRTGFGQGRVMNCQQALDAGMIDRALTFEDLMRKLTGSPPMAPGRSGPRTSVEQLRRRHEYDKAKGE